MKPDRVEDALAALAQGSMVVVDESRESESDLILAAQHRENAAYLQPSGRGYPRPHAWPAKWKSPIMDHS